MNAFAESLDYAYVEKCVRQIFVIASEPVLPIPAAKCFKKVQLEVLVTQNELIVITEDALSQMYL